MNGATPGQAAYEAFLPGGPIAWEYADAEVREMWERIAQAAIDAATEGTLRACGYTLADVGRFLEAEFAAQDARPAPGAADHLLDWAAKLITTATEEADVLSAPWRTEQRDWLSAYKATPPAQPAPGLAAAVKAAVITEIREAANCDSDDGDECQKCNRHADAILAILAAGLPS